MSGRQSKRSLLSRRPRKPANPSGILKYPAVADRVRHLVVVREELLTASSGWAVSGRSYKPRGVPRRAADSALSSDSDLLRRLTQPELLSRPLYLSGGYPRSFRTPGPQPRTDAAMWLKRYSGLLRLHAALLSPAEEFLLRPAGNGSHSSSLQLRSTFLCTYFSPRRPAPRTPFTFYTTGTATRCTVQATPLYSLIPVPQFTLS